jgi:hypothetical protein
MSLFKDNERRAAVLPPGKAYRGVLRVANFGKTLFSKHTIEFVGVSRDYIPTKEEVVKAMYDMADAYDHTTLPDTTNKDAFRDFLYHVRLGFNL